MSKAVALRSEWAERISASWRQNVQGIIETGRLIAEAKEALDHGEFGEMIEADLPFGARTAQMLMAIAADPRLANANHGSVLPASWRTLYELTKLPDEEFEAKVKDGTIRSDMERRDIGQVVKTAARTERETKLGAKQRALPDKRYGVILADPPWRFEPYSRETGMDRAADNHYPTSSVDELAKLKVETIADVDCALFMWATSPMLPQALRLMADWGFDYRSHVIWKKVHRGAGTGTGYWWRNEHELLLLGIRGKKIPAPAPGKQWGSVVNAPIGKHSEKPDNFHAMIEAYFPTLPKIELFARVAREGWDAWGNEIEESQAKAEEAVRPDKAQAQGILPRGEEGSVSDLADDAASRLAAGRTADANVSAGVTGRRDAHLEPRFLSAWEREDYEREKAGLPALGPFGSGSPAVPRVPDVKTAGTHSVDDLAIPDSLRRVELTKEERGWLDQLAKIEGLEVNQRNYVRKLRADPASATALVRDYLASIARKHGLTQQLEAAE